MAYETPISFMLDVWNICAYTWIGKIKTFRSKPWILMVYFVMWIEVE